MGDIDQTGSLKRLEKLVTSRQLKGAIGEACELQREHLQLAEDIHGDGERARLCIGDCLPVCNNAVCHPPQKARQSPSVCADSVPS